MCEQTTLKIIFPYYLPIFCINSQMTSLEPLASSLHPSSIYSCTLLTKWLLCSKASCPRNWMIKEDNLDIDNWHIHFLNSSLHSNNNFFIGTTKKCVRAIKYNWKVHSCEGELIKSVKHFFHPLSLIANTYGTIKLFVMCLARNFYS